MATRRQTKKIKNIKTSTIIRREIEAIRKEQKELLTDKADYTLR